MIKSLKIQNYILIDNLNLDFQDGFTVFTGETGAGKSIIISSIDVALGSKVNKESIKTGKDKAYIELTITINDTFNKGLLIENGIDLTSNELIISREITPTTTRSRINGVLVTQDFIKVIREQLLDIHTQHQNYNYMQPKMHIVLLDNYAQEAHKQLLKDFKHLYNDYLETIKKLESARQTSNITEQQIEFLKFQINEIESVAINSENEDETLNKELNILLNVEKLKDLSYSSYWALYGEDANIVSSLSDIKVNLNKLAELDEDTREIEENFVNALETLKDISIALREYSDSKDLNNEKIDEIQERLSILEKLKRKYGGTLVSVLETSQKLSEELNKIEFSQDEIIKLEEDVKNKFVEINNKAQIISNNRKNLAKLLSSEVTKELEKMELPKVRFSIDVQNTELNENGIDNVEFLISTNISEPLRPIVKVASGGEISRIMLSIKTVFAKADSTNTVIFDEIDTGISGKTSQSVADAIANLAKNHQIFLITHQPIIAAKANTHYFVAKEQNEQTTVKVYNLKDENRVKGIALLAAGEINDDSMNFARGLLN